MIPVWVLGAVSFWWVGATAAGVRRDLSVLEEDPEQGAYALVSLLHRLKDDADTLGLRLRFSRALAICLVPTALVAAAANVNPAWIGLAVPVGVLLALLPDLLGGGLWIRRLGRARGGAGYATWARLTLPPARLARVLRRPGAEVASGGSDRALVLAESQAALVPGGARLGLAERRFLRRLLASTSILVDDIMTRWSSVHTAPVDLSFEQLPERIHAAGRSRLPVLQGERVVGMLTAKDVLPALHGAGSAEASVAGLMRPAYFVRREATVQELMEELQEARVHLAVVVDPLGREVGIVSMEDVLEEIVGELYDERERTGEKP